MSARRTNNIKAATPFRTEPFQARGIPVGTTSARYARAMANTNSYSSTHNPYSVGTTSAGFNNNRGYSPSRGGSMRSFDFNNSHHPHENYESVGRTASQYGGGDRRIMTRSLSARQRETDGRRSSSPGRRSRVGETSAFWPDDSPWYRKMMPLGLAGKDDDPSEVATDAARCGLVGGVWGAAGAAALYGGKRMMRSPPA